MAGVLLIASLGLPIWAVPPKGGSGADEVRQELVQAVAGSASVQPRNMLAPAPSPVETASRTASFRRPSLLPLLNFGFMLFALAGQGGLPMAQAQPSLPQVAWGPPLNLSAPGPVNEAVAGGVNLALARANASGALPGLGLLNDQLASLSPLGASPLATLAQPSQATTSQPIRLNPLLPGSTTVQSDLTSSTDMLAAIQNLNAAQLQEAGRIIQGIGHQILADAGLAFNDKTLAGALVFIGDDLLGVGDEFEAAAAHAEGLAIQEVMLGLEERVNQAQARAFQDASGPDATLDPRLIYGTWERLETTRPPSRIFYTFDRNEFVKRNTTIANRRKAVANEVHPGTVTGYVSYDLPDEDACPLDSAAWTEAGAGEGDACPSTPLGQVEVTILIEQASGKTMTLAFTYLKAQGQAIGKDPQASFDVLVERQGDKKAFVKIFSL